MLLGSPPDMVHSPPLRSTNRSLPQMPSQTWGTVSLVPGIPPCCSGLQVQGTAAAPSSAALYGASRRQPPVPATAISSYIIL